jgi:hypothetical protein
VFGRATRKLSGSRKFTHSQTRGRSSRLVYRLFFCGAVAYAKKKGAKIVEGYPIDMQTEKLAGQKLSSYAGYMGLLLFFVKLVFWKRVALRKHN